MIMRAAARTSRDDPPAFMMKFPGSMRFGTEVYQFDSPFQGRADLFRKAHYSRRDRAICPSAVATRTT